MLVTDAVATALTELGAPRTEDANLPEGSMAQLEPTPCCTGPAPATSHCTPCPTSLSGPSRSAAVTAPPAVDTSLTERIYAGNEDDPRSGILIYTAVPDAEGTLGGLVSQAEPERLVHLTRRAMRDAMRCSSDPLCAERLPAPHADFLHGAACHVCLFLSETTCERGNRFLDRRFVSTAQSYCETLPTGSLTDGRITPLSAAVASGFGEAAHLLLVARKESGVPDAEAGAFLRGIAAAQEQLSASVSVETVWSGPSSHAVPVRATAQALIEVIAEAKHELLLMTYSATPR